jgi:hypothetical protein
MRGTLNDYMTTSEELSYSHTSDIQILVVLQNLYFDLDEWKVIITELEWSDICGY